MTTMDQVKENSTPHRRRVWSGSLASIVLLLIATLAPVLDPVPHESSQEALSHARWPAVTRVAELLW